VNPGVPRSTRKAVMRFFGPLGVCSSPVAMKTMTKSAMIGLGDEMFRAVHDPVAAVAPGHAFHAAHVRPGAGFGHGKRVHPFAAHRRHQVTVDLVALAGHEDVLRPAEEMGERHRPAPEFAFDQREFKMIEPCRTHAFGKIAGIEAKLDGLAPDVLGKPGGHFAAALDQILVGIDLLFDEAAHRRGDHAGDHRTCPRDPHFRRDRCRQAVGAGRAHQWRDPVPAYRRGGLCRRR